MSLENAILDHAAAIRELAAALLAKVSAAPIGYAQGDDHMLTAAALRDKKIADQTAAKPALKISQSTIDSVRQVADEQEAAAKNKKAAAAARLTDEEIEQKLAESRADNAKKAAASAAGTATAAADTQTTAGAADTATAEAQTSYDYDKQVAPVLTKVATKSRDLLIKLLAEFGAKKGKEVPAEKYGEMLAKANELLAG